MTAAGIILMFLAAVSLIAALMLFFRKESATGGDAEQEGAVTDVTKLIEAITKMVGALQKAGPAISLLTASLVFAALGTVLLTTDQVKADSVAVTTTTVP